MLARIEELSGEFERIVRGMAMLGERPPRSVDEAVAIGRAAVRDADRRAPERRGHAGGGGERAGKWW